MPIRLFRRKEEGEKKTKIPEGMWIKCNACLEIIYKPEVERNLNVCPKCNYHFRIPAMERIRAVTDEGTFQEFGEDLESVDMLSFTDTKKYTDRLKEAKKKTGRKEAVITGAAKINGIDIVLAVLDFEFLGGSMGCVVGEKVAVAAEAAKELSRPLIIFSASGGARMQEGTLSLMQMAKTSAALAKLSDARIPFLSVLTDPTTGGVPGGRKRSRRGSSGFSRRSRGRGIPNAPSGFFTSQARTGRVRRPLSSRRSSGGCLRDRLGCILPPISFPPRRGSAPP